ncbi:FaeA-like protein [Streptococcus dysgalactiae subsp. equisimilis SK1250]|nr:FaeA-like protein [Streptococcus dysgalactiae subsp. equisimilis SK1250]
MNKFQRLEEITKLVNKKGTVRVSEIMESFGVTDMTVRRDLIELEEQGLLKKFMVEQEVIQLSNTERFHIKKNIH